MTVGPNSWSTTPLTNGSADSNINFAEQQAPSTYNDSARALMAAIKAYILALGGNITYGGTGNAYTATNATPAVWTAYAAGYLISLKANATNTGAATINVDGLGAKTIKTADGGDVIAGDIVSGGIYLLSYDGTNFQILNTIAGGSYQPLTANGTAFGALSFDATNGFLRATGAASFVAEAAAAHKTALAIAQADVTGLTTSDSPQFAGINVGHASDTTITRVSAGVIAVEGATIYSTGNVGTAGATLIGYTPVNKAGDTMSGDLAISKATAGIDLLSSGSNITNIQLRNANRYDDIRNTTSGLSLRANTSGSPVEALLAASGLFTVPSIQANVAVGPTGTGTLVAGDANTTALMTAGITVPSGVFAAPAIIHRRNLSGGALTLTQGAGMTMILHGTTTTGNRTIANNGVFVIAIHSSTACIVSGDVS